MRYDSTYSALVALNNALGGVQKSPDSEYTAVIDLMSTLNGAPVEASSAFEAVSEIAVAAENGELPIQGGGGTPRVILPEFTLISYDNNLKIGEIGRCKYRVSHIDIFTTQMPSVWGNNFESLIGEDGHWGWLEDEQCFYFDYIIKGPNAYIYITEYEWSYQKNVDELLRYKQILSINCDINVEGGELINASYPEWEWMSNPSYFDDKIDLTAWGDPNNAIVMNTLSDFENAEGYDEKQWFEITGRVTGQQQNETGCIKITDDSLNGREIVINYMNTSGPSVPEYHGMIVNDGNTIKIRTLRWKLDEMVQCVNEIVFPNTVFGGQCKSSPVAILVDDNINE